MTCDELGEPSHRVAVRAPARDRWRNGVSKAIAFPNQSLGTRVYGPFADLVTSDLRPLKQRVKIRIDDLSGPEIRALLDEHLANMRSISPPESTHALPIEGLRKPEVTFWTVWENGELLGCGALKELDAGHGEIKSMRTVSDICGKAWRRRCLITSSPKRNAGLPPVKLGDGIDGSVRAGSRALCAGWVYLLRAVRGLYRRPEQRVYGENAEKLKT